MSQSYTPNREFLAFSRNGVEVTYDPLHSHAATHFEDTPQLKVLVRRIIEQTDLDEEPKEFETNVGRIVGHSDLVETTDNDDIVYAKRKNRDTYARFTRTQSPQPSEWVTVRLEPFGDSTYNLYTAWVGRIAPPFPGNENETPDSRSFWATHALAWGTQEIQIGTETKECPW